MSESLKNKGFLILPLADLAKDESSMFHPHRNSGNEFFWVTCGYLVRNCNFTDIRLNKNDLHLSPAWQVTSISDFSTDIQGFYCRFDDSFLEHMYLQDNIENDLEFISSFLSRYPLRLNPDIAIRISYLLDTLLKLNEEDSRFNFSLIHVYLVAGIYEVKKMMMESGFDFYPSKAFLITKKYNDLLAKHVNKERSVEFYARCLGITPNHLNKSVKSVTGQTAIALLNEMSISEAKMRLKYTNLTISEIAFQLGFEDQSYFSRFFKKATNNSPQEYRKLS